MCMHAFIYSIYLSRACSYIGVSAQMRTKRFGFLAHLDFNVRVNTRMFARLIF